MPGGGKGPQLRWWGEAIAVATTVASTFVLIDVCYNGRPREAMGRWWRTRGAPVWRRWTAARRAADEAPFVIWQAWEAMNDGD